MNGLLPVSRKRERGVALVMAMVFLMLLTIVALASVNSSSLEEKMAGNTQDRNIAFQAAETALVKAEEWIRTQPSAPATASPSTGLYDPSSTTTPVWNTANLWTSANVVRYPCTPTTPSGCGTGLERVGTQPKYIIEIMGVAGSNRVFRITARGTGASDNSVVMLQSTFIRIP